MLNKIMLIGNLGADPELRHSEAGTPICNFSVATTEKWKDKSGEQQEKTEWHRVVVFGKQAENVNKYLHKGSKAFVEGAIQTNKWEDDDGNTRYSTEVKAYRVQFLDSKSSTAPSNNAGQGGQSESFDSEEIPF